MSSKSMWPAWRRTQISKARDMLDFMAHAVSACPRAKAVTFDAFSPSLAADVVFRSVERIRGAL